MLIQDSSDWVVCGEAENGEDAVREVAKLLPDVLLMDASIPLLHGVKVARIVKRDHPAVKVVMMSASAKGRRWWMRQILMPVVVRNDQDSAHRGSGSRLTVGKLRSQWFAAFSVPLCAASVRGLMGCEIP
jgi:chemotaxis response regulator CheB